MTPLERIPASEHFAFEGSPRAGLTIRSATNDMTTTIGRLPDTLRRETTEGIYGIGGAPARLDWIGRRFEGRVLFDNLQRHSRNRFTADFAANWRNFDGLCLMADDGSDFHAHAHEREGDSDLTGRPVGMASWGRPASVGELDFRIVGTDQVEHRPYRWPSRARLSPRKS